MDTILLNLRLRLGWDKTNEIHNKGSPNNNRQFLVIIAKTTNPIADKMGIMEKIILKYFNDFGQWIHPYDRCREVPQSIPIQTTIFFSSAFLNSWKFLNGKLSNSSITLTFCIIFPQKTNKRVCLEYSHL